MVQIWKVENTLFFVTFSDANLAYAFCLDQVRYAEHLFSKESLAILSNCVKTKQRESKALVGDDSIAEPAGSRGRSYDRKNKWTWDVPVGATGSVCALPHLSGDRSKGDGVVRRRRL